MKKIATALLLSTAISAPAFAADQGAFVNLDLGKVSYSNANTQLTSLSPSYPTSFSNPNAISIGGGYHFSRYLAVEADYSIVGDSTISFSVSPTITTTEKLKSSSLQVAAVGTYPISEAFSVFGKLGLANTKIDYTTSVVGATYNPTVAQSASASKTNLMFGIGGQYNINQHFGIRLQYQDFGKVQLPGQFFGGVAAPNIGVKITSIGGVYNF